MFTAELQIQKDNFRADIKKCVLKFQFNICTFEETCVFSFFLC